MKQVVIENPAINSPYDEPKRHFKFTEEGITDEIIEGIRRPSSYFIPTARPRSRGRQAQLHLDTEWTEDSLKENDEINRHGGFGRWAFIEITDPWNAKNEIGHL